MAAGVVGPELPPGKGAGDENFPVGSRLLAPWVRPHVHAYYGFVRAADDISDSPTLEPAEKVARLDAMEAALLGGAGASPHAVALRASLEATGLDPALATDLLVAFRHDATVPRTPDWGALLDYCRHSANPVGRYLLALHHEGTATHAPSDALCTSLQILNHLQDCRDDFTLLGRSYLPGDYLAAEGLGPDAVLAPATSPALARVFGRVLDGVDDLNRLARRLPGQIRDRRMRLEAAVIVALAHRLARRLRVADPLAVRVTLARQDIIVSLVAALRHLPRSAPSPRLRVSR